MGRARARGNHSAEEASKGSHHGKMKRMESLKVDLTSKQHQRASWTACECVSSVVVRIRVVREEVFIYLMTRKEWYRGSTELGLHELIVVLKNWHSEQNVDLSSEARYGKDVWIGFRCRVHHYIKDHRFKKFRAIFCVLKLYPEFLPVFLARNLQKFSPIFLNYSFRNQSQFFPGIHTKILPRNPPKIHFIILLEFIPQFLPEFLLKLILQYLAKFLQENSARNSS